ncbi:hypothetical protein Tco_1230906 [Tanacetum coccineum]
MTCIEPHFGRDLKRQIRKGEIEDYLETHQILARQIKEKTGKAWPSTIKQWPEMLYHVFQVCSVSRRPTLRGVTTHNGLCEDPLRTLKDKPFLSVFHNGLAKTSTAVILATVPMFFMIWKIRQQPAQLSANGYA